MAVADLRNPPDALVEAVARAICYMSGHDPDEQFPNPHPRWPDCSQVAWRSFIPEARTSIRAIADFAEGEPDAC